jgi:methylenetetrahydrofolate reductase (NADPH)
LDSQRKHPRSFSFEFFPAKTPAGEEKLRATWQQLAVLKPKFFSVTFGAGGSTRDRTLGTVLEIQAGGSQAAPHLSCIGSTREDIAAILDLYKSKGVRHIVALRGDLPSGSADVGELRHANELVAFIREKTGEHFHIEVACYPEFHPQAKSAQDDLANFKRKVEAGADSALTQYFFSADCYFRFMDDCERLGITIPVVPGIMPIGNFSQLARFSKACGAEIPRWLEWKMQGYGDDAESVRALGLDVVTSLCERLLDQGAPGLHFYTMNQAELTTEIWRRLGL